ncbi:hypothetical protein JXQ70_05840 [bacterium]|nr:hypothetical protein [bacterium]
MSQREHRGKSHEENDDAYGTQGWDLTQLRRADADIIDMPAIISDTDIRIQSESDRDTRIADIFRPTIMVA